MEISKEQFEKYLRVQKSGKYNMFDPRARQMSGLDAKTFNYIIEHYDELASKYEALHNLYMGGR